MRPNRIAGVSVALAVASALPAAAQERMPEVKSRAKTPCQVHPETAVETAQLWLHAREALEGSQAEDSTPPLMLIQKWRRTLTRSLRPLYERRDTSTVATSRPFGVKTPDNIERVGYIQRAFHSIIFYGPDPDEVLTERFLRQHCFRRVPGAGGTQGLAGLSFEPLPTQRNPDVSGVLWIDTASGALRYVEYTWTNAPMPARAPLAGGRTDFVRLAGGGWAIQRWYIRMPTFTAGPSPDLDGYSDEGGELLAVGPPTPRKKKR